MVELHPLRIKKYGTDKATRIGIGCLRDGKTAPGAVVKAISSFREGNDFSLDGLLQEIVDFIPPACQHPEITCARIIFNGYEFTTKNFSDTE